VESIKSILDDILSNIEDPTDFAVQARLDSDANPASWLLD
jgi:hypothetical protein